MLWKWPTFAELADKFIKQFCYNIDVVPTRPIEWIVGGFTWRVDRQLPNESFATYVGRLMALAAKVKVMPPWKLSDRYGSKDR